MSGIKPSTEAEKTTRSTVDTITFTIAEAKAWRRPEWQRPIYPESESVKSLAKVIAGDGGILPGVITFGILGNAVKELWLLDGQQRREAFFQTGLPEGFVDVRYCFFKDEAAMSKEFRNLNSHLVNMKPDDFLRAMEPEQPTLRALRAKCPFIGYDNIRRGRGSPIVSMSGILRAWAISAPETPANSAPSSKTLGESLTTEDAENLGRFLCLCLSAWGKDPEYTRLWNNLNLVVCAWLYRRLVIAPYSTRTKQLTNEQFGKCLMSLSADPHYLAWLQGRRLSENDRSPCMTRIKALFSARLTEELGSKPSLPSPPWGKN